jgi:hypothetical protein
MHGTHYCYSCTAVANQTKQEEMNDNAQIPPKAMTILLVVAFFIIVIAMGA